jgi:hypothetical protein
MYLKRWSVTLAVAVLLAGLVTPPRTVFAASGNGANAGTPTAAHNPADDGDNSDDSSENPDEGADPGDAVGDSGENSDDPGDHDGPGDDANDPGDGANDPGDGAKDPGDNGSCTSVSSVTTCFDQPRN